MGVVAVAAVVETVDGLLFEVGDLVLGLVADVGEAAAVHRAVEGLPHVDGPRAQQVQVARVAGQFLRHLGPR